MNGVRQQVKAGIISAGWMPPGATKAALTRLRSKRESFDAQRGSMQKKNERRRRRRMRMREEGEEITWAFLALTLAVVQ